MKKLFHELASDETKHRELLQDYLDKGVTSITFSASRDYKVADTLASPDLTPDLKPIDGIIIAIRKELEAMQMYTQLAGAQEDPKQKEIFMQLANMERGHKARLEDIYTDMAFPESW
nr:ferritin family protein [Methanocalculus chunghsingensis]